MTSLVREFHLAMEQAAPTYPSVPNVDLASLRLRLIKEEMKEVDAEFQVLLRMLRSDSATPDQKIGVMQALIKELCDLQYVTEGALVAFGCDYGQFEAVHASNMSKLVDGKPLKREDGKVIKGPNYKKPHPNAMFPSIINIPEEDITECPTP